MSTTTTIKIIFKETNRYIILYTIPTMNIVDFNCKFNFYKLIGLVYGN